jgi:hypothetical protein
LTDDFLNSIRSIRPIRFIRVLFQPHLKKRKDDAICINPENPANPCPNHPQSVSKIRTFSAELCYTIRIMKQKARWSPSENHYVAVGTAVGGVIALR